MSLSAFAELIERLAFTPSRNGKLRLLVDYLGAETDPDRGWAVAALTDGLELPRVKPGIIRALAAERLDPDLFGWSYDYVGDLAETVALMWPGEPSDAGTEPLSTVVDRLRTASRSDAPRLIETWLDRFDIAERYALLKLITGALRIGVSARLAKTALAQFGHKDPADIEELWHGLSPPYGDLFAWLTGAADAPPVAAGAAFRPLMLAHALDEATLERLDAADFAAEWKWDGIRVQLVGSDGRWRLYSRTGDEITATFPDIIGGAAVDAALDGELLVVDGSTDAPVVAPFSRLQQRLNRKTVSQRMLGDHPAWIRLYDILFDGTEDLRPLPFSQRRARLKTWVDVHSPARMDLSPLVAIEDWPTLNARRTDPPSPAIEGVMLKRRDSAYVAGRPKGLWFKWKRSPLVLDTVLMYAQRGHGKRSSFYSDFTFGAWRAGDDGPELVPVGKAYFGFTDEELAQLDKWVRTHTTDRFGPVRATEPSLVLEVAFDSVQRSKRHKSGVAMRFPRIHRIRWDKPAAEADQLATLEAMIME